MGSNSDVLSLGETDNWLLVKAVHSDCGSMAVFVNNKLKMASLNCIHVIVVDFILSSTLLSL